MIVRGVDDVPKYTSYEVAPLAAFQVSVGDVVTLVAPFAGATNTGAAGGDNGTPFTLMVTAGEKLVTVVVPSRFTFIVKANPSVGSLVSTGNVPAGSKNILKANVLPDVETPSGAFRAGPESVTSKEIVVPNVKLSK